MKPRIMISLTLVLLIISTGWAQNQCSLNGTWRFQALTNMDEATIVNTTDHSNWDTMTVPGNWDTENKHAHYVGPAYYQRDIVIPSRWQDKQIRLVFDAVYESAKVWLNSKALGEHIGGYTPFEFNITNRVKAGQTYSLVVRADNTYKRGAWWAWGGITRNVSLVANEDIRLVWQHITALPDFNTNTIKFDIDYKIENLTGQPQSLDLTAQIVDKQKQGYLTQKHSFNISADRFSNTKLSFTKPLDDFELWHFDRPHLYALKSKLVSNKVVLDQCKDRFGIRKVEIKGMQLLLNNESVRLNGFNRIHDHRIYGNTEPEELIKKDIRDMKALGAQFARIMHAPCAPSLLDYCDEIGFLIIEEIPIWGKTDPQTFPNNPLTKQWLKEMIERDYNHACVIGWSVANEIGNPQAKWADMLMTKDQYDYINTMLNYVTTLDSSRLKTYVSYTLFRNHANPSNEPTAKADLLCANFYGNPLEQAEIIHKNFPDKPLFIAEIGKSQIGLDLDARFKPELVKSLDQVHNLPYVIGSALWSYNDYRSNYKGTPPSENRAWGVVDVWRRHKRAWQEIRQRYTPIKALQCTEVGKYIRVQLTPRSKQESPSYTLQDYSLVYRSLDNRGQILEDGKINLQIIQPDDPVTTYTCPVSKQAARFTVDLVTPTGITVYSAVHDFQPPPMVSIQSVVANQDSARIYFKPVPTADEYAVQYNGQMSPATIDDFVDVTKLEPGQTYNFVLIANNRAGQSQSTPIRVTTKGTKQLPPKIRYCTQFADEVVLGYSVEAKDTTFTIEYGTDQQSLNQSLTTELKGCIKLPAVMDQPLYLRIKRGDKSLWSPIIKAQRANEAVFPHKLPETKPDIPISTATERMFNYMASRAQDNELFSQFKYTRLKGLDYRNGNGTVTRRDPSRPIFVNGKYYMWYTKRDTPVPPIGASRAREATDTIPSTDWDLCEIWYATSDDGFTWQEQGLAVPRPAKPYPGHRSVATPDILVWQGKYYLYYQAFNEPSGLKGDWCRISASYADSPDGPWTSTNRTIIHRGQIGDWDQDQVQDPHPIVRDGKIYVYFKAAYNKWPDLRDKYAVGHGLAIATDPLGPFVKHPLNPVLNSGHETTFFPFKEGIAALAIKDGVEHSTMQYAPDGVNFEIASVLSLTPTAAAAFTPDAFTNTTYGRGITWGLCHFINAATTRDKKHSIIARFDCDLSLDIHDPSMKSTGVWHRPEVYFKQGLSQAQQARIHKTNQKLIRE